MATAGTLLFAMLLASAAFAAPQNPILFVTQTPFAEDSGNIVSAFGNHRGRSDYAPRGGDLWIRYPDGTTRNLTNAVGYGNLPYKQIAVRDPYPHWDGTRALFSMVVGGTTRDDYSPVYFQIYEITGIGKGQRAVLRKLPQPENYNNVTPVYASDGRILFTSDRPRNGDPKLYPQLDEYESEPTVSGLWSMNPDGSDVRILDHSPSGSFTPMIDSFGRVVFTRWDHLQRDQQADAEIAAILARATPPYRSVTYDSEESDAYRAIAPHDEMFPEPRQRFGTSAWNDLAPTETEHFFDHFFPWAMHQDGTMLQTLNHLGRHELTDAVEPARTYLAYDRQGVEISTFLQIAEDPTDPGTYYGIRCPKFGTHAAGQIVSITAPPNANPDTLPLAYVTHPATSTYIDDRASPGAGNTGMFRDPVVLTDGSIWASHSTSPYRDAETVSNAAAPFAFRYSSRYDFAIREIVPGSDGYFRQGERLLSAPIVKSVTYYDNYRRRNVTYTGPMWELQPVEVVVRSAPPSTTEGLPAVEEGVLEEELGGREGIELLREWLAANELALVVSRDLTVRADRQQDFNLKVAGSDHRTATPGSTPKEISHLQFVEGKQVRGFGWWPGRRVLARPMRSGLNPTVPGSPPGAVRLGPDGSMAAFVPAGRALSWQSVSPDGTPVVRERYWLTLQSGEIRVCANCHGINTRDVFGALSPENEPQALRELMRWWRTVPEPGTLASALVALGSLGSLRAVKRRRSRDSVATRSC